MKVGKIVKLLLDIKKAARTKAQTQLKALSQKEKKITTTHSVIIVAHGNLNQIQLKIFPNLVTMNPKEIEMNPVVSATDLEFKTKTTSAKPQFVKAKDSSVKKTDTHFLPQKIIMTSLKMFLQAILNQEIRKIWKHCLIEKR